MTDRYIAFANSPVGRRLVGAVGLPSPLRLELSLIHISEPTRHL
ncbi:hypothetical protein, partial [Pseudomonas aeruginosa]